MKKMKRLLPACMVIPCMMFMAGPAAASDSFESFCSYGEQKSPDFFNTAFLRSARRSGMVGAIVMNRYPAGILRRWILIPVRLIVQNKENFTVRMSPGLRKRAQKYASENNYESTSALIRELLENNIDPKFRREQLKKDLIELFHDPDIQQVFKIK